MAYSVFRLDELEWSAPSAGDQTRRIVRLSDALRHAREHLAPAAGGREAAATPSACRRRSLEEGLLLYAEKPSGPSVHHVVGGGPRLRVETVDLTAPLEQVQHRCHTIAVDIATTAMSTAAAA